MDSKQRLPDPLDEAEMEAPNYRRLFRVTVATADMLNAIPGPLLHAMEDLATREGIEERREWGSRGHFMRPGGWDYFTGRSKA